MGDDMFSGLLGDMKDLTDRLKEEERSEEEARLAREAAIEEAKVNKQVFGLSEMIERRVGKKSKKPITDALLGAISPSEVAEVIAKHARAGREWAVKLYVQYIQTPETLNRLAGSEDDTPIRFERLVEEAKSMGLDTDTVMKSVIHAAEVRLKDSYDSPLGSTE